MRLDITTVLALIAKRPKIRIVEIADLIDCDPDQIRPALQPHISRNHILVEEIIAPNGRRADAFCFSKMFMETDVYKALLKQEVKKEPEVEKAKPFTAMAREPILPPPRSSPTPQVDTVTIPAFRHEPKVSVRNNTLGKTNVEKAIEFIQKMGGQVTSAQMKDELCLKDGEYPSTFLSLGLRKNILKCTSGNWVLGPACDRVTIENKKIGDVTRADPIVDANVVKEFTPPTNCISNIPVLKDDTVAGETFMATLAPDGKIMDTMSNITHQEVVEMINNSNQITSMSAKTEENPNEMTKNLPPLTFREDVRSFSCALWSTGELSICKNGCEFKLSKEDVEIIKSQLKEMKT